MRAVWAVAGGAVIFATVLAACTVESRPYSSGGGGVAPSAPSMSGGGANTVDSTQAMLVDIDTNRTMTAQPGDGVGVFTEYAAGGHWRVFWACDTNRTAFDCSFKIGVSTSGPITNAAGESLDVTDALGLTQATSGQLSVDALTSTTIKGVSFDTAPGTSIVLDAQVDGSHDGRILFFVQDGQVNGGYAGELADPLTFEPSSP